MLQGPARRAGRLGHNLRFDNDRTNSYATMKFHQRPEVWILLLGCVLAVGWVLMDSSGDSGLGPAVGPPVTAEEPLRLYRVTLERDYGNARLDIEFRYQNASPRPITLQPPDAKLITSAGAEVPPFILAVSPAPVVAAGTTQDVRLRYWLEEDHLKEGLTLQIRDASVLVKADAPFDLDRLENGKPESWTGIDWKL